MEESIVLGHKDKETLFDMGSKITLLEKQLTQFQERNVFLETVEQT